MRIEVHGFVLETCYKYDFSGESLVPKSTNEEQTGQFGYSLANQFGLPIKFQPFSKVLIPFDNNFTKKFVY